VGLLPPDIDTRLRIETRKGRRHAGLFFVRMPARLRLVRLCHVHFERAKKFSRCTQLFVMMRYYKFQPAGLDIKTCVLLR
jgi:hypothetical protein